MVGVLGLMDIPVRRGTKTRARARRTQRNLRRHLAGIDPRLAGIAIPRDRRARRDGTGSRRADTGPKPEKGQTGSSTQNMTENGTRHFDVSLIGQFQKTGIGKAETDRHRIGCRVIGRQDGNPVAKSI